MDSKHFIRFFETHQWIFHQNIEGITHEESCLAPAGGVNSLNWVLGHIMMERDVILKLLGGTPLWSQAEAAPYLRGTDGRPDASSARPLSEIMEALDRSHTAIEERLKAMQPADFDVATAKGTIGADLAFLQFHESYHAGQVGLLRRLLGKAGIIK